MSSLDTGIDVSPKRGSELTAYVVVCCVILGLLGLAGWAWYRFRLRDLNVVARNVAPIPVWRDSRLQLSSPTGYLLAEVGRYDDEITAYLYFQYLRSLKAVDSASVLLTASELQSGTTYRIHLQVENDLLSAVPYLAELQARHFIPSSELSYASSYRLMYARAQTRLFVAAYDQPVRRKLRSLPRSELNSNVARFILFKSKTDRRIRQQIQPIPTKLSQAQARI